MSSWSNQSLDLNNTCLIPQTINSWALFSECYSYYFKKNVTKALLEIVINIILISLYFKNNLLNIYISF